jgi:Rod binding domain-containing protein
MNAIDATMAANPLLSRLDGPDAPSAGADTHAAMREAAVAFEAVFLAQMLNHAGVAKTPEAFGGGAGEDVFRTHLIQEHARLMAEQGGIGLAEAIFGSLVQRQDEGR